MPGSDLPWRRRDHLRPVALDHLDLWRVAIESQGSRTVGGTQGRTRHADAILFVIALRQLVRAARLAQLSCVADEPRDCIARAIALFDESAPGVCVARDMLVHFDEYEQGTGRHHLPDDPEGPDRFEVRLVGRDPDRLRIGDVTISICAATNAARALFDAAYGALRADSLRTPEEQRPDRP